MRRIALLAVAISLNSLGGCARHAGIAWPCLGAAPRDSDPVEETAIEPVVAPSVRMASAMADGFAVEPATSAPQRNRLTAAECQSRAAAAALSADLIAYERSLAAALACCESRRAAGAMLLTRDLLALRAEEERNRAAADALEAFHRLAALYGRRQQLDQGIEITQTASERLARLHRNGLLPDVDRRLMERQRLELLDQRAQLVLAEQQLNGQLHAVLGCGQQAVSEKYWPEIDWRLEAIPIDTESAIEQGLASRQGLRAVRLVLNRLNTDTLPVARGVLQSVDSSIGIVSKQPLSLLRCRGFEYDEVAVRTAQLEQLLGTSEQLATAEIRAAATRLAVEYQRAALANQVLASWQSRLEELIKKRDLTDTTWLDITQARLELLAAKSNLIERLIAVRIAEVQLRKAQGILTS